MAAKRKTRKARQVAQASTIKAGDLTLDVQGIRDLVTAFRALDTVPDDKRGRLLDALQNMNADPTSWGAARAILGAP